LCTELAESSPHFRIPRLHADHSLGICAHFCSSVPATYVLW
jgi:hypothetical protein